MGVCKYCGKEFPLNSLGGHVARCKLNPNYNSTTSKDRERLKRGTQTCINKAKNNKIEFNRICPKCGKEFIVIGTQKEFDKCKLRKFCCKACANSHNHSEETRRKTSASVKNYYITHPDILPFSSKNKTHKIHKVYTCKYCGKEFTMKDNRDTTGRQYCSQNCRDTWLRENIYSKSGGYRENSGRGKSGWYKGIYCSSTWELAFVIYYLDHKLPIHRCSFYREYEFEGEKHKYYPDFVTNEGIIEIKGINDTRWEAKHKANPDIKVLFKDDIKPYVDYVKINIQIY